MALPVIVSVGAGVVITLLLKLSEVYLGVPQFVRLMVAVGLFLLAASSGGARREMVDKAMLRGHSDADSRQYATSQASNMAMGARLAIVGLTIFALSLFF